MSSDVHHVGTWFFDLLKNRQSGDVCLQNPPYGPVDTSILSETRRRWLALQNVYKRGAKLAD
jgi:hypothetical protein